MKFFSGACTSCLWILLLLSMIDFSWILSGFYFSHVLFYYMVILPVVNFQVSFLRWILWRRINILWHFFRYLQLVLIQNILIDHYWEIYFLKNFIQFSNDIDTFFYQRKYWNTSFAKLSGPFSVIDEHLNTVLINCFDAIGLMLMIRIIYQHQVTQWSNWIFLYDFCLQVMQPPRNFVFHNLLTRMFCLFCSW